MSDVQIVDVPAGSQEDVYFEINVRGRVYLQIAAEDGRNACATFWWIKHPFGRVEQLGEHCGRASFDIPSIYWGNVSAKLRVGNAAKHLKIAISGDERVAYGYKFDFPTPKGPPAVDD